MGEIGGRTGVTVYPSYVLFIMGEIGGKTGVTVYPSYVLFIMGEINLFRICGIFIVDLLFIFCNSDKANWM